MRPTLPLSAVLALTLLAAPAAQQAPAPQQKISSYDRGLSLAMLKEIRLDLEKNYYDPEFRGVDLDTVFGEAATRIRSAQTVAEATAILADTLLRLGDSHTVFYPPARLTRVDYGWTAQIVGDAPYVTWVEKGSDAEAKGLGRGDRVLALNRFEPTRDNFWQLQYVYHYVRLQELQRVIVRKPSGDERILDIGSKVERRPVGDLEALIREINDSDGTSSDLDRPAGDVLVVRLSWFGDPREVDAFMKKARGYRALVLDLRGNGGGAVVAIDDLISWCIDRDVTVGVEKTRKGDKKEVAKGRKDGFTGRMAVLIDSRSASASEVTARVIQLEKRGVIVGDRSAGAVMTALHFSHSLGQELGGVASVAFYGTSITVGDLRMSDGQTLEKVGVTPDEVLLPSPADLAARRDPALARAVTLLGGSMTPEQAGLFYR